MIDRTTRMLLLAIASLTLAPLEAGRAAEPPTVEEAQAALRKAVEFFDRQVSVQGGYVWRYSDDLKRREGEARVDDQTAWVQPPGTPSVGMAYLRAWELTGEPWLLVAARSAGEALIQGQLRSGGWDYRIEFDPERRRRYAYRVDSEGRNQRNVTTLDDNTTQSALRFLAQLDQALEFRDERLHEAVEYGFACLLKAQYPNGAWPQRYSEFPDPAEFPVAKASYPDDWPRAWPNTNYAGHYTFNDNTIADVIDLMFTAADIYKAPRYRQAAERGGEFILLAQMPDPQPAWAQQYDRQMRPAWARKFEPPAVTGGESQGVIATLLSIHRRTGDRKWLEPIPRAIAYLRSSQLPDGRLARFYELKTNRPLYFTKDYQLTYEANDLPTHYAFIVGSRLDSLERQYNELSRQERPRQADSSRRTPPRMTSSLADRARQAIDQLDERGAWVESGRLRYQESGDNTRRVIESSTFARNLDILSQYLAAAKAK